MSSEIGVDVGGTWVRAGVVDPDGSILARREMPTDRLKNYEDFLRWCSEAIAALSASPEAEPVPREAAVGLALPGPVDRVTGQLRRSVNAPFLEGRSIVDDLGSRIGCRPVLCTDADAATWGEWVGLEDQGGRFAHLRLGTGIACGLVLEGSLHRFAEDRSTHLPLLVVEQEAEGLTCGCGLRGCLETIASGAALARRARELGLGGDLAALARAEADGDSRVALLIGRAARGVARAIARIVTEFQVERVAIGGGVLTALPRLFDAMRWQVEAITRAANAKTPRLHQCRWGDDAGIIGAALLAREWSDEHRAPPDKSQ